MPASGPCAGSGGGGGVSNLDILVQAGDLTLGDDYELAEQGAVALKFNPTFVTAEADAIANPPTNFTWVNGGAATSDLDTAEADAWFVDHGATDTAWSAGGSHTAPTATQLYPGSVLPQQWIFRLKNEGTSNGDRVGIIAYTAANLNVWAKAAMDADGAGNLVVKAIFPGGTTNGTTLVAATQNTVWMRLTRLDDLWYVEENTTVSATPPTSGWSLITQNSGGPARGAATRVGIQLQTAGVAGTCEGSLLYWDDRNSATKLPGESPTHGAGYVEDSPELALVADYAVPPTSDAILRAALDAMDNRLVGDTATVQFLSFDDATAGATTADAVAAGAVWAAASAVATTTDGAGGFYNLWMRVTSDGTQAGSLKLPVTVGVG